MGTLDPIALRLGPFAIQWYGVLIATGVLGGWLLAEYRLKKQGINPEFLTTLLYICLPLAILGARLYFVTFHWSYFGQDPASIFRVWDDGWVGLSGLAIHGGLIGAVIGGYLFTRFNKTLSFGQLADLAAPSLLIGQAVGRWGNFINQEAFGGPVTQAFISRFPQFIQRQMLIGGVYHHPTFLYESIWNLLGVGVLLLQAPRIRKPGEGFALYLVWYSVGRFFIEGMRTDSLMLGSIRVAQLVSGLLVIAVGAWWVWQRRSVRQA